MTAQYHERLVQIHEQFPRAYERWSEDEETQLLDGANQGATIEELCHLLKRQPSAIRSRLKKLKYPDDITTRLHPSIRDSAAVAQPKRLPAPEVLQQRNSLYLEVEFSCEWQPVLKDGHSRYLFPEPVTPYMRKAYARAAVYRWQIRGLVEDTLFATYVGMTRKLCPNRLGSYLDPGESATNQRLSRCFHQSLQQGRTILLDVLHIDKVLVGGNEWSAFSLDAQYQREFVESVIIDRYRRDGFVLLNVFQQTPDHGDSIGLKHARNSQ